MACLLYVRTRLMAKKKLLVSIADRLDSDISPTPESTQNVQE